MKIQWYPGHMERAVRHMEKDVKLCDIVIEIVDARTPLSSSNEKLRRLAGSKEILMLLGKADLADPAVTKEWTRYFADRKMTAVALDSRSRDGIGAVKQAITRISASRRERDLRRGITGIRPVRAMVCGIPNVGKSTFINSLLGRASAKTGDTPGVTKGGQWINVNNEFMLLDTPGIQMPRFSDESTGERLAMTGTINDDIINIEELAVILLDYVERNYPECLRERYSFTDAELDAAEEAVKSEALGINRRSLALLDIISIRRGCLRKKGEYDYARSARIVVDDFRSGRMGRISLERP